MPSLFSRRSMIGVGAGGAAALVPALASRTSAAPAVAPGLVALRTPIRVYDSRTDASPLGRKKLRSGESVAVTLSPAFGAIASGFADIVFLNCTVTDTEGSGYLVVRASDLTGELPLPNTSNVNWWGPGQTLANLVLTLVGGESAVEVHCGGGGAAHVIVDVQGYVPYVIA